MTTSIKTAALTLAALLTTASITTAADWNLPISATVGSTKTGVVIGISTNATNGYDVGQDTPTPFTEESLNVYFSHPEWHVTTANTAVSTFHRDIRGTLPQTFTTTIKTSLSPTTLSWNSSLIPATVNATMKTANETIDMKAVSSITIPTTGVTTLDIAITPGDTTPPAVPGGLGYEIKGASIYLTWAANSEADLAGYKLHLLDAQGATTRSIKLGNVTNFNLMNVINDTPYRIAVSAYDSTGNESTQSTMLTAQRIAPANGPDGDVDGDGKTTIADAIKVLRMALHLSDTTNVALLHGDMNGDGTLTVVDAMKLIRRVVGLN
jgi:hypothetical protein